MKVFRLQTTKIVLNVKCTLLSHRVKKEDFYLMCVRQQYVYILVGDWPFNLTAECTSGKIN